MYTMDVTADTVLKGSVAVNFQAATTNGAMVETPRGESRSAVDHDSAVDPLPWTMTTTWRRRHRRDRGHPGGRLINRDGLMVSAMLGGHRPGGGRPSPPSTPRHLC